jgi:signal peptidase I
MLFLTPKYKKQGLLYVKAAEKKLAYNRDIWSQETVAVMEAHIAGLKRALKSSDKAGVAAKEKEIEEFCGLHCPLGPNAWLTENVEVVLVAIIVALGIRTFYVQPFTIPTSSMSPTLKGITGTRTTDPVPNIAMQALQFATHGRTWHDVVAKDDEMIESVEAVQRSGYRRFFSYTRIKTDKNEYFVNEGRDPVLQYLLPRQQAFKKGEPIIRGYSDTGDHVFVNKFIYHFRKPSRGEVIVFLTQNIEGLGNSGPPPRQPSQFYIKRLVGVPGDELSIAPPTLYVNGKPAEESGFRRVAEGTESNPVNGGYRGYSRGPRESQKYNMDSPEKKFTVPERTYFPMGDNSYASKDGRYFGPVPQENMCGSGLFVYWPFLRDGGTHFGLIR